MKPNNNFLQTKTTLFLLLFSALCALFSGQTAKAQCSTSSVIYVDDDWQGLPNGAMVQFIPANGGGTILAKIGCNAAAAIQAGVNLAPAGGKVMVAGGAYPEFISIAKRVTLTGPYAQQTPNCNRQRPVNWGAEACICPPAANPADGNLVTVTANDVQINGFAFTGNNIGLPPSGFTSNGVELHAARAVANGDNTNGWTPIRGLRVMFNVFADFNHDGVMINSQGNPQNNHYVGYNAFDNLSDDRTAVTLTRNAYGVVEGNCMTRVGYGVRIESCDNYNITPTASAIRKNNLRSERAGVVVFDYKLNGAPLDISQNILTTETCANCNGNIGLSLTTVHDGVPVTMASNSISGAYVGVKAYDCDPAANLTLSQSTLQDNTYGVHVLNSPTAQRKTQLTLDHTTVALSKSAGVLVEDAGGLPVSVAFRNQTMIQGGDLPGVIGVHVIGGQASANFNTSDPTRLSGFDGAGSNYFVLQRNGGGSAPSDLPADNVYFGPETQVLNAPMRGADMSAPQYCYVQNRILDRNDDPGLGLVDIGFAAQLQATLIANQTGLLSNNISICAGDSAQLMVAFIGAGPYGFTYSDGANTYTVSNVSANPYTFFVAPLSTTTYQLLSVQAGCITGSAQGSVTVQVTSATLPTAQLVTPSRNVCSGAVLMVPLTVNLTGVAPWTLFYTDGTNAYQETNITATPHTFFVPAFASMTYSLTGVMDSGTGCGGTMSVSTQVSGATTLNVLPALSLGTALTQPDCLNPLGTVQATAVGGAGSPYEYSIDGFVTFNLTGLFQEPQGAYLVEVRDGAGCGAANNATLTLTPPVPAITGVSNLSATSVQIDWNAVAPGALYNLRYREVGVVNWTVVSNLSGASYVLTGLQTGASYEVQLQALCACICGVGNGYIASGWCVAVGFSTVVIPPVCPTPQQPTLISVTPTTATVQWLTVPGAQSYTVHYRIAGQAWTRALVCASLSGGVNTFALTGLLPATSYRVRLAANCNACAYFANPTWSNVLAFATPIIRAELANEAAAAFRVYPNPNAGHFTVDFNAPAAERLELTLTDVRGVVVLRQTVETQIGPNAVDVDAQQVSTGTYFLELKSGEQVHRSKVILR